MNSETESSSWGPDPILDSSSNPYFPVVGKVVPFQYILHYLLPQYTYLYSMHLPIAVLGPSKFHSWCLPDAVFYCPKVSRSPSWLCSTLNSSSSRHGSALLQPQSLFSALLSPATIFTTSLCPHPILSSASFCSSGSVRQKWSTPIIAVPNPSSKEPPRIPQTCWRSFSVQSLQHVETGVVEELRFRNRVQSQLAISARVCDLGQAHWITFWGRAFFWHMETVSCLLAMLQAAVTLKEITHPKYAEMPCKHGYCFLCGLFFHEKGAE